MTVATQSPVLEMTRMFNAPPASVFEAFMNRDEWQSWIGPEGVQCEIPLHEPHIGGRYKIIMPLSDGRVIPVVGVFKTIDAPKTIAFTWKMDGGDHDSLVTITLSPRGDKTEMTLRHDGLGTVENRDGHGKGWNSALNKLETYLRGE
jgi:uncharacterized protein YndB with AHSA1/START domain